MLGIRFRDEITNVEIRGRTGITDFMNEESGTPKMAMCWIYSQTGCGKMGTKSRKVGTKTGKRSTGVPQRRWSDDMREVADGQWIRPMSMD